MKSERVIFKANQIRGLEKLQVQKSRCFGALVGFRPDGSFRGRTDKVGDIRDVVGFA